MFVLRAPGDPVNPGTLTTAIAGSAPGVGAPVDGGVGSPNVLVTVKSTLLERFVGESNVTESPEAEQLAFTPSSWQA